MMKTRLLKKLRKKAIKKFRIESFLGDNDRLRYMIKEYRKSFYGDLSWQVRYSSVRTYNLAESIVQELIRETITNYINERKAIKRVHKKG